MPQSSPHAIYMVSDDNYLPIARANAVALSEMWKSDIHIFVENKETIQFLDEEGVEGVFTHKNLLSSSIPAEAPKLEHWPIITYARLFGPKYLHNYSKVIYLDIDVYPVCARPDIWNLDLEHGIGAVQDAGFMGVSAETVNYDPDKWPASVGLTSKVYFNAGVLLIDVAKWNNYNLIHELKYYLSKYADKLKTSEQDFLNWVFEGKWTELSPSFNYQRPLFEFGYEIAFEPVFVHFSSKDKPWMNCFDENTTHAQFAPMFENLFNRAGEDMLPFAKRKRKAPHGVKAISRKLISTFGIKTKKEVRYRKVWEEKSDSWYDYFYDVAKTQRFADTDVVLQTKPRPYLQFDGAKLTRRLIIPKIGLF